MTGLDLQIPSLNDTHNTDHKPGLKNYVYIYFLSFCQNIRMHISEINNYSAYLLHHLLYLALRSYLSFLNLTHEVRLDFQSD